MIHRNVFAVLLACILFSALSHAATISVPGDYASIQAAVDAATEGDVIQVAAGNYAENVVVNRSVSLVGAGGNQSNLTGTGFFKYPLRITADNASVTGFRLYNSWHGVSLENVVGANISSNILMNNVVGIYLNNVSGSTFRNNVIDRSGSYDVSLVVYSEGNCRNDVVNNTGESGKAIAYYNASVNLTGGSYQQVLLCNADGSRISNVTLEGYTATKNNGLYVYLTDDAVFSAVNSSLAYTGLRLSRSHNATIEGGIYAQNDREGISIIDSDTATVRNPSLQGNQDVGIRLSNASHAVLEGIQSDGNQHGIVVESSHNVSVTAANASGNDDYGLSVSATSESIFANNVFLDNGVFDFNADTADFSCTNTLTNNTGSGGNPIRYINRPATLTDTTLAELILCGANHSNITNVTIAGSWVDNNGVLVITTSDAAFSGLNATETAYGLSAQDSPRLSIADSHFARSSNEGIILVGCDHATLESCTFIETNSDSVSITDSRDVIIRRSDIVESGNDGLYLYEVNDLLVEGVTITAPSEEGISHDYGRNATFRDNAVSYAGDDGSESYHCNDSTYENNTITGSYYSGIYLDATRNAFLTGNTVTSSDEAGVYLEDAYNTTLYDNYFNNSVNAYLRDIIYENTWNTTPASRPNIAGGNQTGGNYWATPSGNGFSETCTNADGNAFCDTAYVLGSGNTDYHPLTLRTTTPCQNTTFYAGWNLVAFSVAQ